MIIKSPDCQIDVIAINPPHQSPYIEWEPNPNDFEIVLATYGTSFIITGQSLGRSNNSNKVLTLVFGDHEEKDAMGLESYELGRNEVALLCDAFNPCQFPSTIITEAYRSSVSPMLSNKGIKYEQPKICKPNEIQRFVDAFRRSGVSSLTRTTATESYFSTSTKQERIYHLSRTNYYAEYGGYKSCLGAPQLYIKWSVHDWRRMTYMAFLEEIDSLLTNANKIRRCL